MKKELTIKQQDFLNHLIKCNGDPKEAAKKAGYTDHYQVTKALKTEIIDPYISIKNNEARVNLRIIDSQENLRRNDLEES